MKTISIAMFFGEQENYLRCSAYCIRNNCSMTEAQVALFGEVVYDWEQNIRSKVEIFYKKSEADERAELLQQLGNLVEKWDGIDRNIVPGKEVVCYVVVWVPRERKYGI